MTAGGVVAELGRLGETFEDIEARRPELDGPCPNERPEVLGVALEFQVKLAGVEQVVRTLKPL